MALLSWLLICWPMRGRLLYISSEHTFYEHFFENHDKGTLERLSSDMDGLQNRAFSYKSYQKSFKIEVTKYEELEQVHAELRLKELLWNSMDEWDVLIKDWYDQKFDTIDPDDMGNTVTKYAKDVHRLEKGLPPNTGKL